MGRRSAGRSGRLKMDWLPIVYGQRFLDIDYFSNFTSYSEINVSANA